MGGRRHADGVHVCAGCVIMCRCVSGWRGYSWGMLESARCVGHGRGQRWAVGCIVGWDVEGRAVDAEGRAVDA